eukprot:4100098-Amphidinium_carterae.2
MWAHVPHEPAASCLTLLGYSRCLGPLQEGEQCKVRAGAICQCRARSRADVNKGHLAFPAESCRKGKYQQPSKLAPTSCHYQVHCSGHHGSVSLLALCMVPPQPTSHTNVEATRLCFSRTRLA